jgi:hypothetical protein
MSLGATEFRSATTSINKTNDCVDFGTDLMLRVSETAVASDAFFGNSLEFGRLRRGISNSYRWHVRRKKRHIAKVARAVHTDSRPRLGSRIQPGRFAYLTRAKKLPCVRVHVHTGQTRGRGCCLGRRAFLTVVKPQSAAETVPGRTDAGFSRRCTPQRAATIATFGRLPARRRRE